LGKEGEFRWIGHETLWQLGFQATGKGKHVSAQLHWNCFSEDQDGSGMTSQTLVEQLLALPDIEAQKRFLAERASALSSETSSKLKDRATQLLRSDIQRSLQITELLFCLAELTGDPIDRALGLLAEANARGIGMGEYNEAITLYNEAAEVYLEQGRPVDQARSQVGKIWALVNLGRYMDALEIGEWASHILEEHGEWQILAGLTMNLAMVYGRAGNDARSLEMFDRAGELYHQMQEQAGWLHMQLNRAIALCNLGRFEEAIQASLTASKGLEQLGQKVAAARARQGLALTYFILGRYNEALDHLDQVRDIFLADGRQRDAMMVELFISDCLLQLRRFGDVLDKCRQVRNLFTELGMPHPVAQAIVNEAVAYTELGRYTDALNSLAEARQAFADEGNRVQVAATDLETAAVLQRQGRHAESLIMARECAVVFEDGDLPIEQAQAKLVAAQAATALGDDDQALRLTTAALGISEERNVPTLKYKGYQLLGALAAGRGDLQSALDYCDRAIREVERLRGRLMVEFRVGFVEDKEEIYEDAVGVCLELGRPLRGLQYAERAKSRVLLDLLSYRLDLSVQARSTADRPLVEEMMRLRAERDCLYRRWEGDPESGQRGWVTRSGARGQAQQEVMALEKRITELWHRLLIRNADYAREASLWTVRTESPQPCLPSDTLLLEFFFVHGKPIAFLVTKETVQAKRLDCHLAQLRRLMQLLWLNLKAVPMSEPGQTAILGRNARGLLGQLYELLLAPVAEALTPFQRLIIVPHGPLHYLPFHALHNGDSFLLEECEVSYLPSASFLRYCEEAPLVDGGLLAIGHSQGGRLPHATQEACSVAALLEGEALVEDQATLTELQQRVPQCRILHLATHGDFRPDNPLFSGLALADGWLTTLDIFNLQLPVSLVTLSACQTGRNVVGGGDELLGLMRAFLYAGAASLVLSLWAVEDRSTADLMEAFYGKLASGWAKGRALRYAQLELVKAQPEPGQPDKSHPYFWAPFFLVGNTGPL
jgi:tetratricopeptide (TPR) repeat protein